MMSTYSICAKYNPALHKMEKQSLVFERLLLWRVVSGKIFPYGGTSHCLTIEQGNITTFKDTAIQHFLRLIRVLE